MKQYYDKKHVLCFISFNCNMLFMYIDNILILNGQNVCWR